ncbi:hypothetical protein [Xanthomonas albilineans]|uniref:hypothetical protein n=1 Tax=Xanthomonas albilineans TaxID=29447 RepID=UPI000A417260|nr:hypothetical protein [Xanthomonas albilineans]
MEMLPLQQAITLESSLDGIEGVGQLLAKVDWMLREPNLAPFGSQLGELFFAISCFKRHFPDAWPEKQLDLF